MYIREFNYVYSIVVMLNDLLAYIEKGQATYSKKGFRGLNLAGKLKFAKILLKNHRMLKEFEKQTFYLGECYIGPFIGEFGNFLLHMLPFLGYLHKNGIRIHYCGMENQTPFLVNENGDNLLESFVKLRDFFHEVRPSGNSIEFLPKDVDVQVKKFQKKAVNSRFPFLDIYSNTNLYWYSFRNWQLKGKQYIYDLSKVFGKDKRYNKVVIFPRKMNSDFTQNNGGVWDYFKIGDLLSNFFDEVVFIGHPSMSDNLNVINDNKIKLELSTDNKKVLTHCSTAKLMITQHSGAMHVSGYTKCPTLLIFNGPPPIKGLDDSIRFRANFPYNEVDIAFSYNEIINKISHE